ncbi:hypothetical protein MY11210_008812 [Beauveria gryllotalpidicola]
MKISASVLLLSALVYATCAFALFTIPDTLPDGVYQVEKQTNNPQQHPKIKRMDIAPAPAGAVVAKRGLCSNKRECDDDVVVLVPRDGRYPSRTFLTEKIPFPKARAFCRAPTHTLTLDNLHAAVNRLFYTPLFWIPPNSARFALYNGTVAYVCNLGDWGSGSLVEYMEAMRILDERCVAAAEGSEVRAAKLSVVKWEKFYGREVAGVPICQWEGEKGGIRNELLEKERKGCLSYVNGMRRLLGGGDETECNDDATGFWLWEKLWAMFPWYNSRDAATNE